ncbi:hypothetical protein DYBT9623_02633 [Dyadobacter sp. CECT 9623]|uniref:EpsG family protein n=1 Tax=Dyadobacter linearis TaxID=2823330 RepID=A0ABN7RCQ9_9BACT|nr:EpsG family protein [Dyadobacter sp. CECT 9623]CAG5069896.1 hypothetical protein DYBT9623_02633 [Dyadobacter sp. CECT 9623]
MTIYFVLYFVFFVFTLGDLFISRERKKPLLVPLILLGVTMIVLAGLRWETGTDWPNYFRYFNTVEKVDYGRSTMEIGYESLVRSFKFLFGAKYTGFLFICATFLISLTYYTVYKVSPYPIFSLFLLLSYSVTGSSFGVRQDLSISLTLLSFIFIEKRSFYRFAAIVFIASLLHNSAIVFFPAYYLYKLKWNVLTALFFLFVLALSFYMSSYLIQTLGTMVSEQKTEFYMELGQEALEDPYTSLMKGLSGRLLFLFILAPFVNYSEGGSKEFNGIFNLYVFGIILYTIFTPISPVFSRIARSYDIFQILAIPYAYYITNRFFKLALIMIIFTFSIYKFQSIIRNDPGILVPYKTIYTN